ncbi:MAG TPA: ATP-binding protein [Stellaceae bacterium]|nr:ATP-binding protein [Stellaceae bacterium]
MGLPGIDYEGFFNAIMSASLSAILVIDNQLRVLHASRSFLATARTTGSDMIGRRICDVFPVAFWEGGFDDRIREVIGSGARVLRERISHRMPGMPQRIYTYSIGPLPLCCGGRAAILVLDELTDLPAAIGEARQAQLRDESAAEGGEHAAAERRALEAQLRQAEKLAALGMVIGEIAHELRNPLGISSAAAQLLKNRTVSAPMQQECVEKVIAGIARASRVVESLLCFARPGRGRETTQVDVVELLRNALMFASGEAAAGVTVSWNVEGPVDAPAASFCTDGVQHLLELVMINMIANAFQAMPAGGQLSLAIRREGEDIAVEIGDTGCGIPETDLPRIFDPFFTTRSDTRRSGLGLSVSHSIVQQHRGGIAVRSRPGEGTLFVIRLRASAAPQG